MHKVVSSVIIALLLSSILEIGFIIHPVNASGESTTLGMTTMENVSVLENGTLQISILMNVSSGPLADLYRKVLAAPSTANIEEEVPIPDNATQNVDAGRNATDVSLPVREGFYDSIVKEQLLSLGLITEIVGSGMVPRGSGNECRIMFDALGCFEVSNVTNNSSNQTWEVDLGPFNTTGITGIVLSRLMLAQMMLASIPGDQVYQNWWHTKISLPSSALLLSQGSLYGWEVDFGGGTYLNASASLQGADSILIDENTVITENNVTATPEYLANAFSTYKIFQIRYSLPNISTVPTEHNQGPLNTNWSYKGDTGWVPFPDISLPFSYADSEGDSLDMRLTISPNFSVTDYVGWQFFYDRNFPFMHLDRFWAQMNFSASIGVRFEANATLIIYQESWRLYYLRLLYGTNFYGVPVVIYVVFTIDANLLIKGHMSFVAEAVIKGEVDTGVVWDHTRTNNGRYGWDMIYAPHASANVTDFKWQLAVGMSVTPGLSFRLELLFYGVAGPFVEFDPNLNIDGTLVLPNATILWDMSINFDITAGVTLDGWLRNILGLRDWNWFEVSVTLWNYSGIWSVEPPPAPQEPTLTHNLQIVSLIVSPSVVIANNNAVVNFTVRNDGSYNETSDILLSENGSMIASYTNVNLTSGKDCTFDNITWNSAVLLPGSYVLEASVNPVVGENNTADNAMNNTAQIVANNDFAIVDVKADPNETYAGHTVNIAVTVENLGELTEDSNVTVSANDMTIETRSINQLRPDQSITMTFIWSTGGLDPGHYVVWANVSTLDYDINMANNNLTDEENIVRLRISLHDVAVTDVVPYRNWVYEGRVVPVNVTLLNCGDFNETVTVDLYYNLTANQQIGTIIADLSPNETKTLTFVWNTLGVQHCHNYTITALANIQFDSNTTNNVNEGTMRIKVRIMGDLNGDGNVRVDDALLVASAFGSQPGHPRWNPDADVNGDGKVRVDDALLVARNFGMCAQ